MKHSINLNKISLLRYIGIFIIDYLAIVAVMYIFIFYYKFAFSLLFCFIALFIAAYAAAIAFVREQKRAPRETEHTFLTISSFLSGMLITFLISLFFIDYYYLLQVKYRTQSILQDYSLIGNFFITILGIFAAYFVVNIAFGWAARKYSSGAGS